MSEEDLLKSKELGEKREKKPDDLPEADTGPLTDEDADRIVAAIVEAAGTSFIDAPGEARTTATERLGGDPATVEAVRTVFSQRAGDLRDWLLKKVRGEKPALVEQPLDAPDEEVSEPTGPTRMFKSVDFESVDSVRPPLDTADLGPTGPSIDREAMKTSKEDLGPAGPSMEMQPPKGVLEPEPSFETGESVKDRLAKIIRDNPEQFDMLTETVEDKRWTAEEQAVQTLEQKIADIELKQAALIYELHDLAGYVPGLREVRDQAVPNIEYAREVINKGKGKEGTFVDLFTPEQLASALEKVATRQVEDSTQVFGASFDDWVNKTGGTYKAAKKELLTVVPREEDEGLGTALWKKSKEEAYDAATTFGLSQAWRLAKVTVSAPIKSVANITKAGLVLGTRFGSAALEGMRRRGMNDKVYPNVVESANLLSRGADTQKKLDRMMEIQQRLHALRRERTTLQKADTAGTIEKIQDEIPKTVEHAAQQMVEIQLWQDAADQAFAAGDDARVAGLMQDTRPIEEILPIAADQHAQMLERATTLVRNRPAIRDVCRKYLGTELKNAGHRLSQAGLKALQRGKFLYAPRADGSLEVELLLEPTVKKRRPEYDGDGGGFEADDEGGSLHMTIPADMVERLLGEAASGNYQEGARVLNDEALNRIFEGNITEPAIDDSLGQSKQTEKALANIQRLMKQVETAIIAKNIAALTDLYDQIHTQYQPDQLGTELTFSDPEQQAAYDHFVIEIANAQSVIATKDEAKIAVFHGKRMQELENWLPGFTAERTNQLAAKFTELADSAANKTCRYKEQSVVTLPGKMMGGKEPVDWTILQAKNKVYLLEQNGKRMVMRENDLANWVALANKQANKPAKAEALPRAA